MQSSCSTENAETTSWPELYLMKTLYAGPMNKQTIVELFGHLSSEDLTRLSIAEKELNVNGEMIKYLWLNCSEDYILQIEEDLRAHIEAARDEMNEYIQDLHEYNELKDLAQVLLGKLADVKATTLKDVYEELGIIDD